ncbi:MAG: hypothetical protein WC280_01285 [Patescibacteria group bacterium]
MEAFKEIKIFGFDFLVAKKGIRMSDKEAKQIKETGKEIFVGIDKLANFVNKNELAGPIIDNTSYFLLSFLKRVGVILSFPTLFILYLIFSPSIGLPIIAMSFIGLLFVRLLFFLFLIIFVIALLIYIFCGYAKMRKK